MLDDVTLARIVHVLAVVLWIGGVAFVTSVLLPAVRRIKSPHERIAFFAQVERRFAWQARVTTMLAGVSGLYMIERLNLWSRFSSAQFWWMHAMIGVWALFTFMLFVAEPLFLHEYFIRRAAMHPDSTFRIVQVMHWLLLLASLIALAGALAGAHGASLFASELAFGRGVAG